MSHIKEKYLNNIPFEEAFDDFVSYEHEILILKDLDHEINNIIKENKDELRNRTETSKGVL